MLFSFDEKSLLKHTGRAFFERGRSYRRKNRVLEVKRKGEGEIVGKVRGSNWRPYTTSIALSDRGGVKRSVCSCPLEGSCKHVAALGLAALDVFPELNCTKPPTSSVKNGGRIDRGTETAEELAYVPEGKRVESIPLRKKSQPKKSMQPGWMTRLDHVFSSEKAAEDGSGYSELRDVPALQCLVRYAQFSARGASHWRLELRPRLFYARSQKTSLSDVRWSQYGYSIGWACKYLPPEHKALVFSQFTSFLAYVRDHLDSAGFEYLYLDGATKKRGELVRRFQTDETQKIFLISLKAGGFGLNLTAADYCFILDPWWNPAVETQAIDRAHRIGQTKNVFVYKMITKGTIEEKVLKLQQKKRALFDSVLEKDAEFHQLFTEKDVRDLFS